ncbi:MAG: hypothetical protein V5A60_01525 [Haloarculaceae archaeon]
MGPSPPDRRDEEPGTERPETGRSALARLLVSVPGFAPDAPKRNTVVALAYLSVLWLGSALLRTV